MKKISLGLLVVALGALAACSFKKNLPEASVVAPPPAAVVPVASAAPETAPVAPVNP